MAGSADQAAHDEVPVGAVQGKGSAEGVLALDLFLGCGLDGCCFLLVVLFILYLLLYFIIMLCYDIFLKNDSREE